MAQVITCIIVEDNENHCKMLTEIVNGAPYVLEILETCVDIKSAIAAINTHKPQLVFVDICLGTNKKGGFELLQHFKKISFDVIFTTSYIDENISEIRRCGLHFIVKPYVESEVNDVLKLYCEKLAENTQPAQIEALKANLLEANVQQKTSFIKVGASMYPIEIKNIIYCYSTDPRLSFVFYTDNSEIIAAAKSGDFTTSLAVHPCKSHPTGFMCLVWHTRQAMKHAEVDFTLLNFCLVHKSYLVNLLHTKKFVSSKTGPSQITMTNGDTVPISANGKLLFTKATGKL